MIIKAKDLKKTTGENLRDGKGLIHMTHFLDQEGSYNTGRVFSVATIPPGSSIGKHTHEGEYEIYYVLKGSVHVMDNDTPATLDTGDCMLCKDGENHSIENKSDTPAEVLFLVIFTNKKA